MTIGGSWISDSSGGGSDYSALGYAILEAPDNTAFGAAHNPDGAVLGTPSGSVRTLEWHDIWIESSDSWGAVLLEGATFNAAMFVVNDGTVAGGHVFWQTPGGGVQTALAAANPVSELTKIESASLVMIDLEDGTIQSTWYLNGIVQGTDVETATFTDTSYIRISTTQDTTTTDLVGHIGYVKLLAERICPGTIPFLRQKQRDDLTRFSNPGGNSPSSVQVSIRQRQGTYARHLRSA